MTLPVLVDGRKDSVRSLISQENEPGKETQNALRELGEALYNENSLIRETIIDALERNDVNPYHGSVHTGRVLEYSVDFWRQLKEASGVANEGDFSETLVKLVALYHDFQVGDNINTPEPQRDEVVSARTLRDVIYKQFNLDRDSEKRAIFDKLIQQMQVAIVATTVNKKLAFPSGFGGGKSTIYQFDLIERCVGDPGLRDRVVKALGYDPTTESGESLAAGLIRGKESLLAKIICSFDLAHFAEKDERVFWEMTIRYGLEVGVLQINFSLEAVINFLKGQVLYLENYSFPSIMGSEAALEEGKSINVKRVKEKLKAGSEELYEWYEDLLRVIVPDLVAQ